jgi:hypothetical protein
MVHRYSSEQADFIAENIKGRSQVELTKMFNAHFKLQIGINQIRAYLKNHSLRSGLDCSFKPGHTPFNKGLKGLDMGGKETQFKKGHRPLNYKPIGTERVNGDDYVDIKIADPNKWRAKHLLVWEKENGSVPKGHVVIFGDGNRRNFDINNLLLVSRGQLAIMNRNNLIQKDAELTRTGIIVADIFSKIGALKKAK